MKKQMLSALTLIVSLIFALTNRVVANNMESSPTPVSPFSNGEFRFDDLQERFGRPMSVADTNISLQATGGPDDFGYTWNDSNPYYWIDARAGTDTHLGLYSVTDLISLGFTFKFYENSYSDIYISSVGAVGFSRPGLSGTYPVPVPSSKAPNNFIAPFFSPPLRFNAGGIYTGTVYYLQGGTEPNRYFVVEWYGGYDYTNGPYTFEVILYENGNIDFNYQSMVQQSYIQCDPPTEVAIENAYGDDGLAYIQAGCQYVTSLTGKTVRFARPASSARTQANPKFQGTFARPGETITFQTFIRNTGDFGSDTYDLSYNSTWPVTFYPADGTTPLSDTNGNGKIDTGALAQASVFTVTVKAQAPITSTLGATNIFSLTVQSSLDSAKSKTVTMQAAVPAPFVQAYRDYADDAMSLYLVSAQMVKKNRGRVYQL
jgi:hypothetical protein